MNSKQFRLVLIGLMGVSVVVFIGLYFMGTSALSAQSRKMVDLKLKNKTADTQLANLEVSKKEIAKYSYFKSVAKTVIPNDKDQAQAVLDILQIADQTGISLQSVSFPSSNLGIGSTAPASGSASSGGAASPSTPTSPAISQAQPVSGIPGLYSIQLTITPATGTQVPADKQVTYPKVLDFLRRIESNRRTAQVTQVNIQPLAGANSPINFSLTINIFIKP
ncbi:MAG: hypothetical protein JWO96_204 [Candidatus Saccharibacteria bacterium]|nr:hypothetical protein [Candidatus Saccharibacteria bacterium]